MNKKIKSILIIMLVSIILSLFSGCVNNDQVTSSFEIKNIKSIEFTEGKFKKIVDRHEDIKTIQDLLNKLNIEVMPYDGVVDGWKYEFKVINENEELNSEIVIYKDYLSYNNKIYSYSYQDKLYSKLNELYKNLEYDEVIEKERSKSNLGKTKKI